MQATRKQSPTTFHLGYLDGLRAISALYVVVHHALAQADGRLDGLGTWKQGGLIALFGYGDHAVELFIVLSGFCLMMPVVRGDGTIRGGTVEYLKRRSWRILPPYYLSICFVVILDFLFIGQRSGTIWDNTIPITWKGIIAHLFMLHDSSSERHTINYVLWTISVEWRIYFLFPLLVWFWKRGNPYLVTALTIISSYILFRVLEREVQWTLTVNYFGLFATGAFAAGVSFSKDARLMKIKKLPWGILSLFFLTIIIIFHYMTESHLREVHDSTIAYFAGFSMAALIIMVSLNHDHSIYRALSWKPLVFVGTFSYSLYLIHAPLLQLLWQALPSQHGSSKVMFALLAMVGTPIIVVASYLFFLVGERPFLKTKIPFPRSLVAKTAVEPAP